MATTRLNLAPIGQVCGKHRHYDPQAAEAEIRKLQAKDRAEGKPPAKMVVYWCHPCGAFHVTRKRP